MNKTLLNEQSYSKYYYSQVFILATHWHSVPKSVAILEKVATIFGYIVIAVAKF